MDDGKVIKQIISILDFSEKASDMSIEMLCAAIHTAIDNFCIKSKVPKSEVLELLTRDELKEVLPEEKITDWMEEKKFEEWRMH